jgi:hypothetical protein
MAARASGRFRRKLPGSTPKSATSMLDFPLTGAAFTKDMPTGVALTPGVDDQVASAVGPRVDRLKVSSEPGWKAM